MRTVVAVPVDGDRTILMEDALPSEEPTSTSPVRMIGMKWCKEDPSTMN